MTQKKHLIIGCGPAALSALEKLEERDEKRKRSPWRNEEKR